MRFLILSDIHSNLEALKSVLFDAEGLYDRIVSAGDLVGYGADPEAVVDWARSQDLLQVRGNHDKACAGLADLEWFSPNARAAAVWTMTQLSEPNLEYLRGLPQGPLTTGHFDLMHGSPWDEDEYMLGISDFHQAAPYLESQLTFFGHSHLQGGFLARRGGLEHIPAVPLDDEEQVVEIPEEALVLVNPGSVGQPRDGDPRAAYVLFSTEERVLRYRRVAYDVPAAQRKIRKAGLPAELADRLGRRK